MGSLRLKATQKLRKKSARGRRERGVARGGGKLNPVKLFFHSLWVWHRALTTHARCEISCSKCKPDGTRLQRRECLEFNPLSHVRVTARPLQRCHHAALKQRSSRTEHLPAPRRRGWAARWRGTRPSTSAFTHTKLGAGRVFFIGSLRPARHGHTHLFLL